MYIPPESYEVEEQRRFENQPPVQNFEVRAFIIDIKQAGLQLSLLNAQFKGEYEFSDYIYSPQDRDFDLNKEFIRLRVYQKTEWNQKAVELSHKIKSSPGMSGSLKEKKQFDTIEEANPFLSSYRFAFSYQRKGLEYQLGDVKIFLEDVQGLPPSVELVSPLKKNIDQLFDKLAPTQILSDSIPKLIQNTRKYSQELPTAELFNIPVLPATHADVTRIYFIHNAESEYSAKDQNGTKFTSGRSPEISLSKRGKEQAKRLGTLLSSRIAEAVVFLPPAERAKETAIPFISDAIIMGAYCEGLFEVGMGAWEGKPKDQSYKNEYQRWKELSAADKYITPKVALGESYNEAAHRAMQDLKTILQSNSEKTILIISGENLLNALAIRWMHPVLSEEPGSDLPMLPMEKGDFFLVEAPRGKPIEQAELKILFHIGSF